MAGEVVYESLIGQEADDIPDVPADGGVVLASNDVWPDWYKNDKPS